MDSFNIDNSHSDNEKSKKKSEFDLNVSPKLDVDDDFDQDLLQMIVPDSEDDSALLELDEQYDFEQGSLQLVAQDSEDMDFTFDINVTEEEESYYSEVNQNAKGKEINNTMKINVETLQKFHEDDLALHDFDAQYDFDQGSLQLVAQDSEDPDYTFDINVTEEEESSYSEVNQDTNEKEINKKIKIETVDKVVNKLPHNFDLNLVPRSDSEIYSDRI